MPSFRLRMLGSLSLVREDGTPVRAVLKQPKRFSVLAYLAAGPPEARCPRDTLLGLLWPELDDRRGRKALRQVLYELRRVLGPGVVTGKGAGLVGVDPDRLWSDVRAFTVAVQEGRDEEALQLYRGPFLAGLHVAGAPAFERWVDEERRVILRQAVAASWRLVDAAETAGDPQAARRWGEKALELAPYDEEGLRRYLALMSRLGQPAAAMRTYGRFVERLDQELGLKPSAGTAALVEEIRNDDGSHPGASRGPGGGRPTPPPRGGEREARDQSPGPPMHPPEGPREADVQEAPGAARGVAAPLRRRGWGIGRVAAAAAVVVLAVLTTTMANSAGPELEPRRVVVLPLENRTDDGTLQPVGQIAADWIVHGLADSDLVDVVPSVLVRETLARVGQDAPALDRTQGARLVARDLRAAMVVVGSFHRRGTELEFQAQILDAEEGRLVEAIGGIRGRQEDPMAAVDELRHRILGAVGYHFDTRLEQVVRHAHDPPSYESYLAFATGLDHRERYRWRESAAAFRRAYSLDTTFVAALFMAALDHLNLRELAKADSLIDRLAESREELTAVERLLLRWAQARIDRDPDAALEAVRGLADYSDIYRPQVAVDALWANRPAEAVRTYEGFDLGALSELPRLSAARRLTAAHHRLGEHVAELDRARGARQWRPASREPVLWEARALFALGRVEPGRARLEEALDMHPDLGWWSRGEILLWMSDELRAHGHEEEARALLPRVLDWHRALPDSQASRPYPCRLLAAALLRADSLDAAEAAFERLADEFPDDLYYPASLAVIAVRRGEPAAARRIAASLGRKAAGPDGYERYERARIAAELGDTDDAIRLLHEAVSRGYDLVFVGGSRRSGGAPPPAGRPHLDPAFDALRDHLRFRALKTGR